MTKPTPGPWRAYKNPDSGWNDWAVESVPLRSDEGHVIVADVRNTTDDPDSPEAEGNARLIAAAPEMLEALQNLENDDGHIPPMAWSLVADAVEKAGGRPKDRRPVGSGWADVRDEDVLLAAALDLLEAASAILEDYDCWAKTAFIVEDEEGWAYKRLLESLSAAVKKARGES